MTKQQKPSKETLAKILDFLVQDPVLANAMRSVGLAPNTVFLYAKLSREGTDDKWLVRWPDREGAELWFHEGIVLARQMQCANFEATLRRDCTIGTPRILRTPDGQPVWEVDPLAVAQWPDKETASALGGVDDWPFVHDQRGARVAVVVYDAAPAALRQHAARSLLAGFNPSDRREVDARHSGGVMIVRATQQGAIGPSKQPPPYSREAMAAAQAEQSTEAPMSDLRRDLLARLQDLRNAPPGSRRTTPDAPVRVEGGRPTNDPPEGNA